MAVNIEIVKNLAIQNDKMEVLEFEDESKGLISKVRKWRSFSPKSNVIM
jgi:hypothetical protein